MRDIPADRLLALQEERQLGANVDGIRLPPTIDGYFLPGSPPKLIESGQYNAVPIIASSNGDDLDVRMNPITRAKSINEFRKAATERYKGDAEVFFDLYPISQDSEVPQVARLAAAEGGFVSGSRNCAKQLASKFNTATYIALFTRKPSFAPGAMIADIDPANTGAYHTADIPFWLGTLDTFNQFRMTRQWTEQDRSLSAAMIETLINFARTGNPTSDKWKWPKWQSNDEKIMVVGDQPTVQPLAPERMEFHRAHPFVLQPPRATAPTIRD
jgi:para-nitrobenzyl esterase